MGTTEIKLFLDEADMSKKSVSDIVTGIIARAATPLVTGGMGGSAAYNLVEAEMSRDGYLNELMRRLECQARWRERFFKESP